MSKGLRSLTSRTSRSVDERGGRRRGLVNLAQILQAGIVGGHLFLEQLGMPEDDRDVISERVLEAGFVRHNHPRSDPDAPANEVRIAPAIRFGVPDAVASTRENKDTDSRPT